VQAGQRCAMLPSSSPPAAYRLPVDDSFGRLHHHQGIDIFGAAQSVGITPVVAAYRVTHAAAPTGSHARHPHPRRSLQPGRQIWAYYTHMAMPDGTSLIPLISRPGLSKSTSRPGHCSAPRATTPHAGNPVGVHLHFSIVLDDGENWLRNELNIHNTLDPSPYLGSMSTPIRTAGRYQSVIDKSSNTKDTR